jgi:hypothetical protein
MAALDDRPRPGREPIDTRRKRGSRRHEHYLPRYAKESQEDYNARLRHAPFVNHFVDDVRTIASKPFSKEVVLHPARFAESNRSLSEALLAGHEIRGPLQTSSGRLTISVHRNKSPGQVIWSG